MLDLDLDDKDVLDMGCGTGVLALAAMKLGASKVLAIDIEEGAYRNTLENAKLNDLDGDNRLNAVCGDASKLGSSPTHDLILANINRNILLADMATYDSVLKVGGKIALSGFFIGDVPVISEETERLGWSVVEVLESDGWACIICVKTPK
jgi:ribosomal protein L11 methyltransferase